MVATLTVGLTAVTGVFSVVKRVLLEPLPFEDASRVVRIWEDLPLDAGPVRVGLSLETVGSLRTSSLNVESIAVHANRQLAIVRGGNDIPVEAAFVSPTWCDVLRVKPAMGRCFLPDEEHGGRQYVAVLTRGLWRDLFGAGQVLRGQSVELSGQPSDHRYLIVGVVPDEMAFPEGTRLWLPETVPTSDPGGYHIPTLARLKPTATIEGAAVEVANLVGGHRVVVRGLLEDMIAEIRPRLLLVFAAVIVVLAVSCANVAAILLSQFERQSHDFAVLRSLGANTRHLFQRCLADGLVPAALAATLALLTVHGLLEWSVTHIPVQIPRLKGLSVDGWTLLFSFLCVLLVSVLFGSLPLVSSGSPGQGGRGTERTTGTKKGRKIRRAILLGQSIVLLSLLNSASLLVRSYRSVMATDPGFEMENLFGFRVHPNKDKYSRPEGRRQLLDSLAEHLRGLPGVEQVGLSNSMPFRAGGHGEATVYVAGRSLEAPPVVAVSVASGAYLRSLRVRVLEGRLYDDAASDIASAVVVNRSLAVACLDGDAVGKELAFRRSGPRLRVVGVIDDIKLSRLTQDSRPTVYLPLTHGTEFDPSYSAMYAAVRYSPDRPVQAVITALRGALDSFASRLHVEEFALMTDRVRESEKDRATWTALVGLASLAGLALAVIGIYGLTTLGVVTQTREIGLRMALGATPHRIALSFLREVLLIAAGAFIPAWVATTLFSGLFSGLLYRVSPTDSVTLILAWVVLVTAAIGGSWKALRLAMNTDPASALRHDP